MRALICAFLAGAVSTPLGADGASQNGHCSGRWAEATPLDWRAWREVEELRQNDPAAALAALDCLALHLRDPPSPAPAVAAHIHELRGSTLETLGRRAEAAEAYLEALRSSDGIVRLVWADDAEGTDRVDEIDPGAGRLEAAARALAAAGRPDEARPLVERALALGAGADSRKLWAQIGGGRAAPLTGAATVLTAPRWFPALPELEVERIDGTRGPIRSADAKVTIIDFWASWCVPCAEELPRLAVLHAAERERGLEVVTVNMGEPAATARMFAEALGLSLPVALYDGNTERAFDVRTLPTLIVIDRRGRIRQRWNGYREGLADELAALVRELLDDERAIPADDLAEVSLGAGLLEPIFTQQFPSRIEGLVPVGTDELGGDARLLLLAAKSLAVLDHEGAVLRRHDVGPAPGLLRRADLDGDGKAELLGFRRGAPRVALLAPDSESVVTWDVPAPVLDVELARAREDRGGDILLGTTAGLFRAGSAGPPFEPFGGRGFGEVRDVATVGGATLVLEADRLTRIAADGLAGDSRELALAGEHLLVAPAPARTAVAGEGVTAWAAGRFSDASAIQFAVATAGGQLMLLDAETGRPLFRARWPSIQELVAADVDRDGRDDLVIAADTRLSALSAASRE